MITFGKSVEIEPIVLTEGWIKIFEYKDENGKIYKGEAFCNRKTINGQKYLFYYCGSLDNATKYRYIQAYRDLTPSKRTVKWCKPC